MIEAQGAAEAFTVSATGGAVILQEGGEAPIAGRQIQGEHIAEGYPGEGGVFQAHGLAGDLNRVELDDERGIRVIDGEKPRPGGMDNHTQLFGQFSAGSLFDGFSRFQFPPWELPKAAMPLVSRPPADQEAAVTFHHGCHHTDFFDLGHRQLNRNHVRSGIASSMGG